MTLKLLMKRSRSSSFASSCLSDDDGTSSLRCFAPMALRMQVRKSATGSLTDIQSLPEPASSRITGCCLAHCVNGPITRASRACLPAALDDARDLARERQLAEADAAHAEVTQERARPATAVATVVRAHLELRSALPLLDDRLLRHS